MSPNNLDKDQASYVKPEYPFSEVTGRIIAAAKQVHKNLGPGFEEVIYQRALALELSGNNLEFSREVWIDVNYRDHVIGRKRVDFIIEDVMVEIVDTETGRQLETGATGEIVATTFSKTFPMIRFATGDLSYLIEGPCPCGRTSVRLGKIMGRTDQVTKVYGIFIHPWQVDEVMARFPLVANFQIVVTRKDYRDEMTIYIELKEEGADQANLKRGIETEVREVLKVKGEVVFTVKGGIPDRAKKIDDRRIWE